MIKSMTGFGRESIKHQQTDITVEMKSFNHRFLDLSMNLPREWSYIEEKIKQTIRSVVSRGKVDLLLTVEEDKMSNAEVVIDDQLLNQYIHKFDTISQQFNIENDIKLSHLLTLPDLFSIKERMNDQDDIANIILSTVKIALGKLSDMRQREGAYLSQDLEKRLGVLQSYVNELKDYAPAVVEAYQERLQKRMEDVLSRDMVFDEQRLLTEVAVFADKANIDEELTRLESHIEQFHQILTQSEPIGRKLDFLIQEMNREINTIGSKGNHISLSRVVVEVKSELEKMREQVQNIE